MVKLPYFFLSKKLQNIKQEYSTIVFIIGYTDRGNYSISTLLLSLLIMTGFIQGYQQKRNKRMMKKLFLLLLITIAWNGCAPSNLLKNGGTRITLEANVSNLLHDFIQPGDSTAFTILAEAQQEYDRQEKPFVDLYFSKLDKAAPNSIAAAHFIAEGLKSSATLSECKSYFDKKVAEGMENIEHKLQKRLFEFGVIAPIFHKGERMERLIIEIPGEYETKRIESLLQSTAKLELWETYENRDIAPLLVQLNTLLKDELHPDLNDRVPTQEKTISKGSSLKDQLSYEERKNKPEIEKLRKLNPLFTILSPTIRYNEQQEPVDYLPGPAVGYARGSDTSMVNTYISGSTAKKLWGPLTKFLWSYKPMGDSIFTLIAIRTARGGKAQLSGNLITNARTVYESGSDRPQISMEMDKESGWDWKKMTRENIGKSIAIVVDDHVYSYPTVMGEIPNGYSSITGSFTREEADDLVNLLKAGYLPMEIKIIKEEKILPGGK
jgi:SecD/SecF fusion protein